MQLIRVMLVLIAVAFATHAIFAVQTSTSTDLGVGVSQSSIAARLHVDTGLTTDTSKNAIRVNVRWNDIAKTFTGFYFNIVGTNWNEATSKPFRLMWDNESVYDFDYDAVLKSYYRGVTVARGPTFHALRAHGTNTAAAPVSNGTRLGGILMSGYDGFNGAFTDAAEIRAEVDGEVGNMDMPGRIVFAVTPDGYGVPEDAWHIKHNKEISPANSKAAITTNWLTLREQQTDPAPPANGARLFSKKDVSGKAMLCVLFTTGSSQCFVSEP